MSNLQETENDLFVLPDYSDTSRNVKSTVDFSRFTTDGSLLILTGEDAVNYIIASCLTLFKGQLISNPTLGANSFHPFKLQNKIGFIETEIATFLQNCFDDTIEFFVKIDNEKSSLNDGYLAITINWAFVDEQLSGYTYIDSIKF